MDYQNWQHERDKIIDDVLSILRGQKDQESITSLTGNFNFNPQIFKDDDADTISPYLVVGPITFEVPFQGIPVVTFGQHPFIDSSREQVFTSATETVPFLVIPFVQSWRHQAGAVDGFSLGMYINVPDWLDPVKSPPNLPNQHTVMWKAEGTSTRYRDERVLESWIVPGDYSDPHFLIEDN